VRIAVLLAAVVALPLQASAAPGNLDPSFGTGGQVAIPVGNPSSEASIARAGALQPDGKIVAAGTTSDGGDLDFALLRYDPSSNQLDPSFGSGGKVVTPVGSHDDVATAVVVQPDGRLVAAGYTSNGTNLSIALVRYLADGRPDRTFGPNLNAIVVTPIGDGDAVANAAALQPDGKLVVAGYTMSGSAADLILVRYLADGSLDQTFGQGGIAHGFISARVLGAGFGPVNLALQPDGRIVLVGSAVNGTSSDVVVLRYDIDGNRDMTFGLGGKVVTDVSGDDTAAAVAVQSSDGKIVVAGGTIGATVAREFLVLRYAADGQPDPTFGPNRDGRVVTFFTENQDEADSVSSVVLQPDGKIVVVGSTTDGIFAVALARYNAGDGSPDQGFGTGGLVTTLVGIGDADGGAAAALQPDGKIVVVGQGFQSDGHNDFVLVRYLGGPAVCGNHVIEAGEQCDDGNVVGGDCCSASCQIEESLACHAGDLLVGDRLALGGHGALFRVDASGKTRTRLASGGSFRGPGQIAIDPSNGTVLVTQFGDDECPPTDPPPTPGSILRIDPATGVQTVLSSDGAILHATGVAVDRTGALLVTTPSGCNLPAALVGVDLMTGAQRVLTQDGLLVSPAQIAIAPDGQIYVADDNPNNGQIVRIDPTMGYQQIPLSSHGLFSCPESLAISNGVVLVTDACAHSLIRLDGSTQSQIAAGGDLDRPEQLVFAPDGHVLIANSTASGSAGAVVSVDPSGAPNGSQSVVATGLPLVQPVGIALITTSTTSQTTSTGAPTSTTPGTTSTTTTAPGPSVSVCGSPLQECDPAGSVDGKPEACCTPECRITLDTNVVCGTSRDCEGTRRCDGKQSTCPDGPPVFRPCTYAGPCGAPTKCDGRSLDCPFAVHAAAEGFECAPENACQLAATCDGQGANCPQPIPKDAGIVCGDTSNLCNPQLCDGNGACQIEPQCGAQLGCNGSACETVRVNCTLAAGSKKAKCTGQGFADVSHPTSQLAAQTRAADETRFTTPVTDKVKLKIRPRGPHTLTLHLNREGKKLLKESASASLQVLVKVNAKDNTGRTGVLTELLNLLRHR
jgi:uncharacterized delta-60 repeat protein